MLMHTKNIYDDRGAVAHKVLLSSFKHGGMRIEARMKNLYG